MPLDDPEVLVKIVAELSVMLGELVAIEDAGEAPEYPRFGYDYARETPIVEEKYRVLTTSYVSKFASIRCVTVAPIENAEAGDLEW